MLIISSKNESANCISLLIPMNHNYETNIETFKVTFK